MQAGHYIHHYRLVRFLGDGGMGQVWLAEHMRLGRLVAIKALHPHLARNEAIRGRFKQEAATLSQLSHPNIVALHDYIEDEAGAYLIMEYVDGKALDDYIEQETGPIPEQKLKPLFAQILEAFIYAHGCGIVHRDIKPGNVLVTKSGGIKVLDFGIAKLLGEGSSKLTKTGMHLGTIFYMSPEQVRGVALDHRSDIYALGVTLFQMATGRCPYPPDATEFYVYDRIVNHPLPPAVDFYPAVGEHLEALIAKATQLQPENRFQDCAEFLAALQDLKFLGRAGMAPVTSAPSTVTASTAVPPTATTRPQRGLRWRVGWVLLLVAIGLGIGVASRWPRSEDIPPDASGRDRLGNELSPEQIWKEQEKDRAQQERLRQEEERRRIAREKKQARLNFLTNFTTEGSAYQVNFFGGISDYFITVTNQTSYSIDRAVVEVRYFKANGETYTIETLVFEGIAPNSWQRQRAPSTDRGTRVEHELMEAESRAMELCYATVLPALEEDSYHCLE